MDQIRTSVEYHPPERPNLLTPQILHTVIVGDLFVDRQSAQNRTDVHDEPTHCHGASSFESVMPHTHVGFEYTTTRNECRGFWFHVVGFKHAFMLEKRLCESCLRVRVRVRVKVEVIER